MAVRQRRSTSGAREHGQPGPDRSDQERSAGMESALRGNHLPIGRRRAHRSGRLRLGLVRHGRRTAPGPCGGRARAEHRRRAGPSPLKPRRWRFSILARWLLPPLLPVCTVTRRQTESHLRNGLQAELERAPHFEPAGHVDPTILTLRAAPVPRTAAKPGSQGQLRSNSERAASREFALVTALGCGALGRIRTCAHVSGGRPLIAVNDLVTTTARSTAAGPVPRRSRGQHPPRRGPLIYRSMVSRSRSMPCARSTTSWSTRSRHRLRKIGSVCCACIRSVSRTGSCSWASPDRTRYASRGAPQPPRANVSRRVKHAVMAGLS
jgi:hypothetical protein